jgi:hypothetical protein
MSNKKSHNKKRNVGIIYEQLILTLTDALVNEDMKKGQTAKTIIKKYFSPGTELYKEHRLFNSLIEYYVSDGSLATRILQEARLAAVQHNKFRLNKEKSKLIKEINMTFGHDFYRTRVKNYKNFATVQRLLNNWRQGSSGDLQERVELESLAHTILTEQRIETVTEPVEDSSSLVVKIMTEKFNSKYGNKLNETQKMLIKNYALSAGNKSFATTLSNIKAKSLAALNNYERTCTNEVVKSKISVVKNELKKLNENISNDHDMSKFLTLCQLCDELTENV